MAKNAAAERRKQLMNARRERLEAALYWSLIALGFDVERAQRTARDQVKNALPFARAVGYVSGWDYERMEMKRA